MLTRILALVAILLLAPSMLVHAHARALSLESASLGIFARNVDLLKEIPDLTHCCIKEKSTEPSESSNRREEYLRARYMDPGVGRFTQPDRWAGNIDDPLTLNKFLYANANPIDGWDPSGYYTQKFGYLVEEEIEEQYRATHPECGVEIGFPCYFGVRQYFDYARYLKPDVMNWSSRTFLEIKPFSPSGIAKAPFQLQAYRTAYGPPFSNFSPDTVWTPVEAFVDGKPTGFVNAGGVIFYTDDDAVIREFALGVTLATAASVFRATARKLATRLGTDAVARIAINNGMRAITAANSGRAAALVSNVALTRF